MTDSRLAGADFVRAFACLMVLAHHVAQRLAQFRLDAFQKDTVALFMMGAVGVCAFFVLSGYLLSRPFWVAMDAGQPIPSLRTYAIRRAARILPGFWLALVIVFVLSFTLLRFELDAALVTRFVAGFFGVSSLHWSTWFPVEFNLPLWSISCEIVSYALLAFCLWLLFKSPARGWWARIAWLAVIAVVLGGQWLMQEYGVPDRQGRGWEFGTVGGAKQWWPDYNPIGFYAMFTIGVLAAGIQVRTAKFRSLFFDVVALGGLGLAAQQLMQFYPSPDAFGFLDVPYAFPWFPVGIGIVLVAVPSSVLVRKVTEIAPIAYIARVSFGVYIWHFFLMEVTRVLWQPSYVYDGMRDVGQWAWISAAIVVASFAIATVSYYLIEAPVIRWARGLEQRRTPVSPTLSPSAG